MSGRLIILAAVTVGFAVLTALAIMEVSYLGILTPLFQSLGGAQVLADFLILAVLACLWMRRDARTSGVPAWPFIAVTVALGSVGPLLYLMFREVRAIGRHSTGEDASSVVA